MDNEELKRLVSLLEERNQLLLDRERELADRSEELSSQKEELTAAIEEVVQKNAYLNETLHKLQQRNQELDQILYRASHDLRSPVSSMFGLLDLLKAGGLTSSQEAIYSHLIQKSSQMMALLNSLSTLSQAAFDSIQPKVIDLNKLIDRVIYQLHDHPNFKNVSIHRSITTDKCKSDEMKLSIIIKCLVENALSFRGPDPGTINIFVRKVDADLVVQITDDGDGIGEDIRDKIFNMFYRGSEKSHGAGLGLYIVKSISDRLNGKVEVSSKTAETTFTVTLPNCYDLV